MWKYVRVLLLLRSLLVLVLVLVSVLFGVRHMVNLACYIYVWCVCVGGRTETGVST